jgi:hypothetical protein
VKKNNLQPDRLQMAIWRIRISCGIPKATSTYSEYEIVIALPLQQLLHETHLSVTLQYTACLFEIQKCFLLNLLLRLLGLPKTR